MWARRLSENSARSEDCESNRTTAWMQELAGAVAAQGRLFSDNLLDKRLAKIGKVGHKCPLVVHWHAV